MKSLRELIGGIVLAGCVILGLGLLFSWPLMSLWNHCLVGTIQGIGPITSIWHSWGILILSGLVFKNTSSNSK